MLSRSTWLHLRIPFSYFLLPVFLFAVAVSPNLLQQKLQWVFLILHFLVYPASNGYNSYFDKDEKSIGGLKNPPPVTRGLYLTSLLLDLLAIILGAIQVGTVFAVMIFVYGLASKAYSHPLIRLKKYPIGGWLTTGFFQGCFTFITCYMALNRFDLSSALHPRSLLPAILTSLMLWANYPMTQVYQHEEDGKHGDSTLSMKLGINGTFMFAGLFFALTTVGFLYYFLTFYQVRHAATFLVALSPVVGYFTFWFWRVWKNPAKADFAHTMWLNFISATCLIAFFVWFLFDTSNLDLYLFG